MSINLTRPTRVNGTTSVSGHNLTTQQTGTSISQYGITVLFAYSVSTSQDVVGNYFVQENPAIELQVASITPAPTNSAPYRNGVTKNPTLRVNNSGATVQWHDDRLPWFEATDRLTLPFVLVAGDSLVATASVRDKFGSPPSFTPTASGSGSTFGAGTWSVGVTYKTSAGESTITKTTLSLTAGQNIVIPAITLPNQPDVTVNYYVANVASNTTVYLSTNAAGTGNVTLSAPGSTSAALPPVSDTTDRYDKTLASLDPLGDPFPSYYMTDSINVPDNVIAGGHGGPVWSAMIISVVSTLPVGNVIRPTYLAGDKTIYSIDNADWSFLLNLPTPTAPYAPATTLTQRLRAIQRPWIDHGRNFQSELNAAQANQSCSYGRDYSFATADVGISLHENYTNGQKLNLKAALAIIGLDNYAASQLDSGLWFPNGGHRTGRKATIEFFGKAFGILSTVDAAIANVQFQEDMDHPVLTNGAITGWKTSGNKYASGVIRVMRTEGDKFYEADDLSNWTNAGYYISNLPCFEKSEGYERLNSAAQARQALWMHLSGITMSVWKYGMILYADRWMFEDDSVVRALLANAAALYNWDDVDNTANGGGQNSTTLTATATANVTSTLTVGSAAGLAANAKIGIGDGGGHGSELVTIHSSYSAGSTTVPLTAPVTKTHTSGANIYLSTYMNPDQAWVPYNGNTTNSAEANYLWTQYRGSYGPQNWLSSSRRKPGGRSRTSI